MNDFTPTEMMFIFDAVLNFADRALDKNDRVLDAHLDGILDKVESALAARGYTLEHLETYTVK